MDENIIRFINDLRANLEGLPQTEIEEAVLFYEEYLNDALDEGKDIEMIIKELEPPKKLADQIRSEISIARARRSPDLKNFNSVFGNAFRLATKPIVVFWLSIAAFVCYCMVAVLFGGAFASALSAVLIFLGMLYEAFKTPVHFFASAAGAVGAGLFAGGICFLIAYYLFKLGKLFIKLSAKLVSVMVKPTKRLDPFDGIQDDDGTREKKWPALAAAITVIIGLVLFGVSGLPAAYFSIFNSVQPDKTESVSASYTVQDVERIKIKTANSIVRVMKGDFKEIVVSSNQPEWMKHEIDLKNGLLSFNEESSGLLPLFSLVQMHEGMAGVTIMLPAGYDPKTLEIESMGGHVDVADVDCAITIKTGNGNIRFSGLKSYDIALSARTRNGSIKVGNTPAGEKTKNGTEYSSVRQAGNKADLQTWGGNITIE